MDKKEKKKTTKKKILQIRMPFISFKESETKDDKESELLGEDAQPQDMLWDSDDTHGNLRVK